MKKKLSHSKQALLYSIGILSMTSMTFAGLCGITEKENTDASKPAVSALCIGDSCTYGPSSSESLEKMIYETVKEDPNFLSWLAKRGHAALLQTMLARGFKPSEESLVHLAALSDKVDVLKVLSDAHYDINLKDKEGLRPIHKAAESGAQAALEWLIANGVDIDIYRLGKTKSDSRARFYQETPLYIAAVNDKWDSVRWLLEHGADPNVSGEFSSFLDHAIFDNQPDIVDLAIKKGADIDIADPTGTYPLDEASLQKNNVIVKIILAQKAEWQPSELERAFDRAIRNGNSEMATLLLDQSADVNRIDGFGFTPLTIAITNDNPKLVELLLSRGADVNKESRSLSPLEWAKNKKEIVDLLKQHGAVE